MCGMGGSNDRAASLDWNMYGGYGSGNRVIQGRLLVEWMDG